MKPTLTPEQKADNKLRTNLTFMHNGVLSAWSRGELKTLGDVYKKLGSPQEDTTTLTFPDLRAFLDKQKAELEERIKSKYARTSNDGSKDREQGNIGSSNPVPPKQVEATPEPPPQPTIPDKVPAREDKVVKGDNEEGLNNSNDYGLHPSNKERVYLYWFQKKSCVELLRGFGL